LAAAVIALLVFPCSARTFGQSSAPSQSVALLTPEQPGPSPLIPALLLARRSVEKYFSEAMNSVCSESVAQGIIGKNGKAFYKEDSAFDYQLQLEKRNGHLKITEIRDTRKPAFHDPARTLLITSGFASMLLIAHSDYETSYTFESAGQESLDGVSFDKIHFVAVPGASSPAALQLRGQSYPLPLSGMLWIDSKTGAITKLMAAVDSSLSDLGLQGMRSEIHYALIQFHDPEEAYWMPVSAVIDVETPHQHWRNVHRFSNYRRFRATIRLDTEGKP
jgi:hypothetical protein